MDARPIFLTRREGRHGQGITVEHKIFFFSLAVCVIVTSSVGIYVDSGFNEKGLSDIKTHVGIRPIYYSWDFVLVAENSRLSCVTSCSHTDVIGNSIDYYSCKTIKLNRNY